MQDDNFEILVWLPSPMGDAILCTPALRAIRNHFSSSRITFLANAIVRRVLEPCSLNDAWLDSTDKNTLALVRTLKPCKFTHAILFKNSFAAALTAILAGIPSRIGYAREARGLLLTDKLAPQRLPNGKFKPVSVLDYYLAIASRLGADATDRSLELQFNENDRSSLSAKLPEIADPKGPLAVFVPGGAFGPSKCWPAENFVKLADSLITDQNATVVISVAPNQAEKQIAAEICTLSNHKLINLAEHPLNLGELKALVSAADIVVTNDTGPRHIAAALGRKVVTLFGPNDPAWTDTEYENEIQIIANVPCAPCTKPNCKKPEHLCMQSISAEMVRDAALELLQGRRMEPKIFTRPNFEEISESFFIAPGYKIPFARVGLTSIDTVFSFNAARNLTKPNLASFRSRLQFEIDCPESELPTTVFLKRYDRPPIPVQLKNRLSHHRRKTCAFCEVEPTNELPAAGISTPKVLAYGEQWDALLEKRSFIITEKIPDAEAIERKLPDCFNAPPTPQNLKLRRNFISQLGAFIKKFHQTGYRHRDLYFSHIFHSSKGSFHLIDLARAFKPRIFDERFLIKDIAQVHYSAPAANFSNTDRLRFYRAYTSRNSLTPRGKAFIRKVAAKANWMARHDRKHDRPVPFAR